MKNDDYKMLCTNKSHKKSNFLKYVVKKNQDFRMNIYMVGV